jgi:glucose uptake protein
MFTPQTIGIALLMMITTAICWGSWANTYKGARNYRFELFYWDYAIGIFLTSLLLAFTLGSLHNDAHSFMANVHSTDGANIQAALAAGVIFNLANLLLVVGIELAGLAVAFPVAIGIALVVGVALSYAVEPRGSAAVLAGGVTLALAAIVLDGLAYGNLAAGRKVPMKAIVVCIFSGLLMGSFAPFVTRALTRGNPLGPYSLAVFFTLGALVSCFVFNVYFMRRPLAGEPLSFADFFAAAPGGHLLGLLGGAIWGLGTVFNFAAASFAGVAISYAIGQAAPMVAALWGVFVWKEFAGAGSRAKMYLALMFVAYTAALAVLANAYGAR